MSPDFPLNTVNHACWMTVVAKTDRPESAIVVYSKFLVVFLGYQLDF